MFARVGKLSNICLVVVLLFSLSAPSASDAAPVKLRLSLAPAAHGFNGQCMNFLAEEVKRITNGEVEVEVFAGGTLVSDSDVLDSIIAGAVDMSHFSVGYVTPIVKELTPFEIFGVYSPRHFPQFADTVQPMAEKVFAKYGVKFLTTYNNDRTVFVATKKLGSPVTHPDQMKGMVVRTSGAWGARVAELWGGGPVVVSLGDVAPALERGTIDIVTTGWVIVGPNRLYESAPLVTITTFNENFIGLIMNMDKFNSLTQFQRDGITQAALNMRNFSDQLQKKLFDEFIQQMKDFGATVHFMTDDEREAFFEARDTLLTEAIKIAGPEGAAFAEMFQLFQ